MATSYFPNGSDTTKALAHSRNLSTLSNTTLTDKTLDSHSTQPLLRSPLAAGCCDHSSRKLGNEDIAPADLSQSRLHRTVRPNVKKTPFRKVLHAFKRQTTFITLSSELIIGIWAVYNAVRYFLAFLRYRNTLGQALSLSFAITTGISAVLALWAVAFSTYPLRFLSGKVRGGRKLGLLLLCLRTLSAFFLFIPSVINVALVFAWKISDLDLHPRCHLDVDVVWSITPNKCSINPPAWSFWVALSVIRFLLTASLITIYLTASCFALISSTRCSHRHSPWLHSDSGRNEPYFSPRMSLTDHHPSDLTLSGDSSAQSGLSRPKYSRSFDMSLADNLDDEIQTVTRDGESDGDMSRFVDRFRSLISQITLETETSPEVLDGSEIHKGYTSVLKTYPSGFADVIDTSDHTYDFRDDQDNKLNIPPLPMALGYNEFGLPYPPEESIRVLGGFVRRMPTIESMGSAEMASRSSTASHRAGNRAGSHPSTQTTLLTINTTGHNSAGSGPPSRTNSLSSRAERLLRLSPASIVSEYGELLGKVDRLSNPSSGKSLPSSIDDTMESRGTATTYHTADSEPDI